MGTLRHLMGVRIVSIAVVTVLTLVLVGAVVLTTTSAGCSVGIKTSRCLNSGPVASRGTPSPNPIVAQLPTNPPNPPPYNPPASNYPPYDSGSSGYPPYDPGSSSGSPFPGPASGSYPPMANPASGSSAPGVAMSCRLPVYAGGPGSGGFIVFPGNTFVADPRSAGTVPTPPGTPAPQQGPGYQGWYGLTYDPAYSKWLAVPYAWLSPDGAHYAYPLNGDVYVQSVAGGPQLDLAAGQQLAVIDVENDGVYASGGNTKAGLWFLPFSGPTKQVSSTGFWNAARHGYAYGTVTSAVPQGASNTILRMDLKTGATVDFFTQPGAQSFVTGFDAQGEPVVQVNYQNGVALFIATGPNASYVIAAQYYGGYYAPFPGGAPIGDSHGLWFSAGNGIVLYTKGAWYWMSSIGGQLAGQCL